MYFLRVLYKYQKKKKNLKDLVILILIHLVSIKLNKKGKVCPLEHHKNTDLLIWKQILAMRGTLFGDQVINTRIWRTAQEAPEPSTTVGSKIILVTASVYYVRKKSPALSS